jgi:hypothetical protein
LSCCATRGFVTDHHRDIERVAAVTDNDFLKIAPRIAAHFAHPEIRVFPSPDKAHALAWLEARLRAFHSGKAHKVSTG